MMNPCSNKYYISLFVIIFFLTTKVYSFVLVGSTPFITTLKTDLPGEQFVGKEPYCICSDKTNMSFYSIELNRYFDFPTNPITFDVFGCNNSSCSSEQNYNLTKTSVPTCTSLSQPLNGKIDVPVETDLIWHSVSNATGYKVTIGTSSGATDVLNAFDVGNTNSYNLSGDFHGNTSFFVTITPYNSDGDAISCTEAHFNTGSSTLSPNCTTLSIPMDSEKDVPVNTDLTWLTISNATGYKLNVGTISGATDILNAFDVGNTNSYNLPVNLPGDTPIFVSIIPYNNHGNTIGCTEESFTTGPLIPVPECTNLLMPLAGTFQVPVYTDLQWQPVPGAIGYILTVETFTDNIDVFNRFDVGNVTSYDHPGDLPENTRIYVIIEPYNSAGEAVGCIEEIFTTGEAGVHMPPKFFTPNNDGFNDLWIVPNPINRISSVFIYNRHGKLLKQLNNLLLGWDGTFNGYALPTDDYWYQIVYNDGATLKGHISLKR